MCLIIDANCAAKFANGDLEAKPVANWLKDRSTHLAIGGTKLSDEYKKVRKFIETLQMLSSRGQVRTYDRSAVDDRQQELEKSKELESDDPHIIALAEISGCRLLYSNDNALHADFTNLIVPKGKVYQSNTHAHLLISAPKCK